MIHIDDNYAIQSDDRQFILAKRTNGIDKTTGKVVWDKLGYYTTLANALEALSRRLMREKVSEVDMTLKEALGYLKALEKQVEEWMTYEVKDD